MKRIVAAAVIVLGAPALTTGGHAYAASAVTLGELVGARPALTCGNGLVLIQATAAPGGGSYTVPGAGVITSFSSQANADPGQNIRLGLFGPPTGNVFPVKATSATFAETSSAVNTFPVRIPVQAGWLLGARFGTAGLNAACGIQTGAGDDLHSTGDSLDGPSVTGGTLGSGQFRVNLTAVWEPDADADGYGDVSQDLCPQSALSHDACPAPDTVITKKPAKHGTKRKVKVKFSSSIAGSTFTCRLDAKPAKPCTSPYKKRVRLGKHVLIVTATSAVGIADPTPALVRFKVTAKPAH